jgi:hypothetical protein
VSLGCETFAGAIVQRIPPKSRFDAIRPLGGEVRSRKSREGQRSSDDRSRTHATRLPSFRRLNHIHVTETAFGRSFYLPAARFWLCIKLHFPSTRIDTLKARCCNTDLVWGRIVQQWMRDRDLLVQETLEFAQRVAVNAVRIGTPKRVEPPRAVELAQIAKPRDKLFEREEIRQRVADFKVTQNKFQREREEYYRATIAKVRLSRNEA